MNKSIRESPKDYPVFILNFLFCTFFVLPLILNIAHAILQIATGLENKVFSAIINRVFETFHT